MKTRMLILVVIVLFAACKQASDKRDYTELRRSIADTVRMTNDTSKATTKLVKTAEIKFKVKNVQQVGENVVMLTRQYGGMVMQHHVISSESATKDMQVSNDSLTRVTALNTTADMIVKIPSQNLEDFMLKISHMGTYLKVSNMDIEDKTFDYLTAKLKSSARQELIGQQEQGKLKTKDISTVLALKDGAIDERIGNLKTDNAVKYSVISLNFYQNNSILKETVANDDPSAYNMPILQRIELAFASGWAIFMDIMIGLINLWVFIVAGVVIWIGIRYYKKRLGLTSTPSA